MNLMTSNPTMSSREIAALTGKGHPHVKRDIETMLRELGKDVSSFGGIYLDSLNRQQIEYHLDRELTETLITGYSIKLRHKVIQRLRQLEEANAFRVPQTMPEALRLAADLAEQVEAQKAQLAIAAPKVAFVESYVEADGLMGFRKVAKLLGAKEPAFRSFLIDQQIMYRLEGVLTPYAQHLDAGRFSVKTGVSDNCHAFTAAKFTPNGVEWVAGEWAAHLLNNTTVDDLK